VKNGTAPAAVTGLFARLREHAARGSLDLGGSSAIPARHYYSDERLRQEREILFRRYPLIVGHVAELPAASLRAVDVAGQPVLLVRDEAGTVRAFLNVCRHRGMRLVGDEGVCAKQAVVCPYHGWTYALDGRLRHFLHPEAFPDLKPQDHGLVALPCAVHHGLIWVMPTPGPGLDMGAYLGAIDEELGWFLGDSVLFRRVDVARAANWKLIIDAFLDGYHIRVLHRDTIYPFFMDALAVSEAVPPHIRSAAARRRIVEAVSLPPEQWDLREHCTFTHFVFPNTVFIFHPDYASVISVFPVDADHLRWVHQMLIPSAQDTAANRPHWDRTFQLIEQTVFQREDLFAAEGIQAGLRSGANTELLIGRLEHPIRAFHDAIERALAPLP
jgi:phenylpropionate dioxygenase-like ring-hydroxylating dioxygenase large terminal subunit